jgi:hypothetical protein
MDKFQKPSDSECHTPSSEPFRFYSSPLLGMTDAIAPSKNNLPHWRNGFPRLLSSWMYVRTCSSVVWNKGFGRPLCLLLQSDLLPTLHDVISPEAVNLIHLRELISQSACLSTSQWYGNSYLRVHTFLHHSGTGTHISECMPFYTTVVRELISQSACLSTPQWYGNSYLRVHAFLHHSGNYVHLLR